MGNTVSWYIKLINLKNKDGYKYLYKNYYPSLCRFSSLLIGNLEESKDLVQECFIRLWRSDAKFENEKALSAYLYLSVKNAGLNVLRQRVKMRKASEEDLKKLEELELDSKNIQQIMIEEEVSRLVYEAVNKLSPERRNVILLALEGLTNQEIAQQIGISTNTVKSLKLRTYQTLRKDLEPAFCMFFL